jgi:BirA family biotin operon repressor/biotin-[acetyl-CoA-carboxylase] ligase
MDSAFLDANALRAATLIRHVELHDSLGSTNDRAAELARDTNIELPALVATRQQTAGRGRGSHKWWATDGALTFSVLLEPKSAGIVTSSWPQLSLATAVAICDALENELTHLRRHSFKPQSEIRNPQFRIKWPNDVFVDRHKIAGILLESPGGAAPAKDRLIVGVGLNVNNSFEEAPADVRASATSLRDVIGRDHDLQAVLAKVLNAISTRFAQLVSDRPKLVGAWQQLNLLAGQNVVVAADERRIHGRCVTLADDGALVVETARGIELFHGGSVVIAD